MNDLSFIPLLSGKSLVEFTPEEFKSYIRGLYFKKQPRKAQPKKKKPFTFSVNKKGTLLIKVNREPKWLSEVELIGIGEATGIPANVLFLRIRAKEITISTQEEQDRIKKELDDLPWGE